MSIRSDRPRAETPLRPALRDPTADRALAMVAKAEARGEYRAVVARDYRALSHRPAMAVAAADFAPDTTLTGPCATCGGSGFVALDLPVGSPDFGKAHTCPTCRGTLEPARNAGERV